MKLFNKCKRGQVGSYMLIIIVLFMVALLAIIATIILTKFQVSLDSTGYNTGVAKTVLESWIGAFSVLDNAMVFFLVILLILLGLTSYKLPTRSAFFVVNVFLLPFLGFVSFFFNYVFIKISSHSVFYAVTLTFPKSMILCTNFHWIALVSFVIGNITLYGKKDQGQFIKE